MDSLSDVSRPWKDIAEPLLLSKPIKTETPQKKKATINLALFCDRDIGQKLKWQEQQIRSYWEAILFDLHLMFQTLPDFEIDLHVTGLSVVCLNIIICE